MLSSYIESIFFIKSFVYLYHLYSGLNLFNGTACPHYNLRKEEFDSKVKENNILLSYAIEDNSAIEFIDEEFSKSITGGGNSYKITIKNGNIVKEKL